MLSYEDIKTKPKTIMAMTSLKREEFEELLSYFVEEWKQTKRQEASKGGRPPTINNDADYLLFILFLKTYPLQEVIAHCVG